MGNPFWIWVPLPVAIGTFLTAIVVWKLWSWKANTLASKVFAGAAIGVVAHPVSALVTTIVMPLLGLLKLVPQSDTGALTIVESAVFWFNGAVFLVFWWCLISLFGIGWITLVVGAVTGCIIGVAEETSPAASGQTNFLNRRAASSTTRALNLDAEVSNMTIQNFWAERHRDYLRLLGLAQLSPGAHAKIDLSGVIQATMMEAHQNKSLAISEAEQQLPWLRRVFLNNLLDTLRQRCARRRDMRREYSLDDPIRQSASRLETYLQAAESSPSAKAIRHERAELLLMAISRLPADQRTAIELHHLQELPLEQISKKMGRSNGAIAALIYRGMKELRAALDHSNV